MHLHYGIATGLGFLSRQRLVKEGHDVFLHARNEARAEDARRALPEAQAVVVGDLSTIEETAMLAERVNALGRFDSIIHNAAMGPEGDVQRTRMTCRSFCCEQPGTIYSDLSHHAAPAHRLSQFQHA